MTLDTLTAVREDRCHEERRQLLRELRETRGSVAALRLRVGSLKRTLRAVHDALAERSEADGMPPVVCDALARQIGDALDLTGD